MLLNTGLGGNVYLYHSLPVIMFVMAFRSSVLLQSVMMSSKSDEKYELLAMLCVTPDMYIFDILAHVCTHFV